MMNIFFLLHVEEKPDFWYDDGCQELEEMMIGPEDWKNFSPDIRIEKMERDVRWMKNVDYKFDADCSLKKKTLEIKGFSEKMKSEIHAEFELTEDEINSLFSAIG